MSQDQSHSPFSALHAPEVPAGEAFAKGLRWGLVAFALGLVLFFVGSIVYASSAGIPMSELNFLTILVRSALLAGVPAIVVLASRMMWLSRSVLAKTFSIFALAATFFGLAMLVIFLVKLSLDARNWFREVPPLLEARNQDLLRRIGSVEEAAKMKAFVEPLEKEKKRLDEEMKARLAKATSPAERSAIEEEYGDFGMIRLKAYSDIGVKLMQRRNLPSFAAEQLEKLESQLGSSLGRIVDAEAVKLVTDGFATGSWALLNPQALAAVIEAGIKEARDFEPLRGATIKDLLPSLSENVKIFDADYRPDTSAWAIFKRFMTVGAADKPIDAGIMPALLGSIYLGLITIIAAVPLGVGAAIYLEEYKSKGWLPYLVQTNINNLAGIPSVVFGIFGAFLFVELIFKPLNNPHIEYRNLLGGGLTLALLTLPVVIVSAQEAIRAVPQSIRHGALALGATHWQVIWRLVLPNSLAGILTGTILALSRAIGEAAPLVFFGALLYKTDPPGLFTDFTVLPMQIFGWTSKPELLWRDNAGMASLVLLVTLLLLNAVAIVVRQRAQRHTRY